MVRNWDNCVRHPFAVLASGQYLLKLRWYNGTYLLPRRLHPCGTYVGSKWENDDVTRLHWQVANIVVAKWRLLLLLARAGAPSCQLAPAQGRPAHISA